MTTVFTQPTYRFSCEKCSFYTSNKNDFARHQLTNKHQLNNGFLSKTRNCEVCNKSFNDRAGLWRHKKKCNIDKEKTYTTDVNAKDVFMLELLKQNQEFKELMIEQHKQNAVLQEQLLEAVKDGKIGNSTIHNTTNNKFNLNFFLNETCKDAITMNEFINSIEVSMEDFVHTGNIGFVDGISKVMVERIKDMELHARPMHCTDLKRETMYIKNDEKWEREDADKTTLRKAVKIVANKNYKQLHKWYNNSKPNVEVIGSEDCENYFKYYKASLGGYDKEEDKKFEEKIIKNVLKEVVLDKRI